jgi:5'-nucleotidase
MPVTLDDRLVVALSSRALFDFEEENQFFERGDDRAYMKLQQERLEQIAKPGVAFHLVKKLLAFNQDRPLVEVVVLSRNDPISGLRVFRSAKGHALAVQRGVFTRGRAPWRYLQPLQAQLFLSANEADVQEALAAGVPAARVFPAPMQAGVAHPDELRIAFDGDAVLFSDQAEQVYQRDGLAAFQQHEVEHALEPLPPGPFLPLLRALHTLQQQSTRMKVRTALVTARNAPAHERAVRTLMSWNIEVDEAMFLGGLEKGAFLREFAPDFFFDDQLGHVSSAAAHDVPAGHVAAGIKNA